MRPANIITAMADIMAGFAASGAVSLLIEGNHRFNNLYSLQLLYLLMSTIGLYGGGVIFNDVFDASLDAVERPERPIPSGRASITGAAVLGSLLLLLGIVTASMVSITSAGIAAVIALLALLYDKFGKHHWLLGPINMGACRGGNLLLGVSVLPEAVTELWFIGLIPVIYITAITTISRGEVHGGNRRALFLAFALYSIVIGGIVALCAIGDFPLWQGLIFVALFAYLIFPSLFHALQDQQPKNIGKAVKSGILALIVMDAAIAASFAGWLFGLLVLSLLPLSRFLAKRFAVT
jgi:4-hydroxybenzoate polyprenyltransferase